MAARSCGNRPTGEGGGSLTRASSGRRILDAARPRSRSSPTAATRSRVTHVIASAKTLPVNVSRASQPIFLTMASSSTATSSAFSAFSAPSAAATTVVTDSSDSSGCAESGLLSKSTSARLNDSTATTSPSSGGIALKIRSTRSSPRDRAPTSEPASAPRSPSNGSSTLSGALSSAVSTMVPLAVLAAASAASASATTLAAASPTLRSAGSAPTSPSSTTATSSSLSTDANASNISSRASWVESDSCRAAGVSSPPPNSTPPSISSAISSHSARANRHRLRAGINGEASRDRRESLRARAATAAASTRRSLARRNASRRLPVVDLAAAAADPTSTSAGISRYSVQCRNGGGDTGGASPRSLSALTAAR
mmetsp:Transcript_412/g.1677  ORF Transcript_412/g.1677 Transcript_412/m.1677 type:complete len:368 (-) Transcript_412:2189-3292(-)